MRQIRYMYLRELEVFRKLAPTYSSSSPTRPGVFYQLPENQYCAVEPNGKGWAYHYPSRSFEDEVLAADADRLCTATRELVRTLEDLVSQERDLSSHPYLRASHLPGAWWRASRREQIKQMRKQYQAEQRRLHNEVLAAYQLYDEQTSDLTPRREQAMAQCRMRRAAIGPYIPIPGEPRQPAWACRIEASDNRRKFVIWLPTLDTAEPTSPDPLLSDATPYRIQEALDRERAEHPSTIVQWGSETSRALSQQEDGTLTSEAATWKELTGAWIEEDPSPPPEGRRGSGGHGPSSTYGSDFGGSW